MSNPLLNFDQLPYFSSIETAHVLPALQDVLAENRRTIRELENIAAPGWNNFAAPLEQINERLGRVWSPVSHLNGVRDSEELRNAYQQGIELLTEYHSELSQNLALYQQYKTLKASDEFNNLSTAQRKVIDNNLLDFQLGGAELSQDDKQQLQEINQRSSQLGTRFEQNLLDATQAWCMLIEDSKQLAGLPTSALEFARQQAQAAGQSGWLFNLQIPSYLAIMQHAQDVGLREQMYKAYVQRASELSDNGQYDNAAVIDELLALRQQRAELLGFDHYAAYSMVRKMARSADEVISFLNELVEHARPMALEEVALLRQFARDLDGKSELEPWDTAYYAERQREHLFDFTDEQVKPYFPVPQVFTGLFEIVKRLFAIEIHPNQSMQTWHTDVRCFDVRDAQDQRLLGQFYADLYVRKGKRGGAWMDSCIERQQRNDVMQLPVAFLVCNFTPPVGDDPALLTHGEVETLFHEFGHSLHHLLTRVDEAGVAGINGVPWDAVELPSQFLENWCWQTESLALIARHYENGETLPDDLLEKMRAAKNYQAGMQTLRQAEFALFDMLLHSRAKPQLSVQQLLDAVRAEVAVLPTPAYHRFQNSFGHIFAGGYAAGYYSYKWAEVLSADAFSRFEEDGIFNAETGQAFLQSILSRGGVDDINQLFEEFRARPPEIAALLRHTGILR